LEIIDDFLPQGDLKEIQDAMFGPDFAWYYNQSIDGLDNPPIDYKEQEDKFQFVHVFYRHNRPMSIFYDKWYEKFVIPVIGNNSIIYRIKANLLTRTLNIVENEFHTDGPTKKPFTTAIFYLNSNNGYTKFKDGKKVESQENRLVRFPVGKEHAGTSCTDKKVRVVINFLYMEI